MSYIVIQWSLSTLAGGNESDTYLCELWEAFSSAPQLLSFPWKFLLILVELHPVHACADFYLSKDSRGPYLELWSFISEQLLNLKYSACYSSCLGLPEFQSVSSSQWDHRGLFEFALPALPSRSCFQVEIWVNYRASFLQVSQLPAIVQCLKAVSYIFPCFLILTSGG